MSLSKTCKMAVCGSLSVIVAGIFTAFNSTDVQAQGARVLEEVIVSAQRREQSLQEVPISIHTVTGVEMQQQGFRVMEDLGQFSPSVEINESLHEWSVTIRGMGNDVANLSIEQSAPIFVDGVAFGRPSMIKGAFLDVERIEVLTGPQPVYFGQNATAGAFSITTRKPTPEWEGETTTEFGNFGRTTFEGAIGGPITDTWGIRVAGKFDRYEGHLRSLVDGKRFPMRKDMAGRATLQWTPNDNFSALLKAEYSHRRSDGDTNTVCRGEAPDQELLLDGERAVLVRGLVPAYDQLMNQRPIPNCVRDGFKRVGVPEGDGFPMRPVPGINNTDARTGSVDIVDQAYRLLPDGNLKGREPLDSWNFRLGLNYEFDNGVLLEATSALIDYDRESYEQTDESPILMEAAFRTENFDMLSQELRVSSSSGGQIEWAVGVYWQKEDLDLDPVWTLRGNTRRPVRLHYPWSDSEWRSVFGSLTFNFLGDKASLDLGARYSQVEKEARFRAYGATWIFDIDPDGVGDPNPGDGIVRATNPYNGTVRNVTAQIINCATGHVQCGTYGAGFWTHRWRNNDTPDAWNAQRPVDHGALLDNLDTRDQVAVQESLTDKSVDPQITLRYRPDVNHSLYGRWARAFKAGGFDSSDRGPPDVDAFAFDSEHAENFEIGAKGMLFENTLRYGISLFNQTIKDLQIETEVIDIQAIQAGGAATGRGQTNAGKQRTRGAEFDLTWAATNNLTLSVAGVIQKGVMLDFIGGCTEAEFATAEQNDCWSEAESIALVGSPAIAGFYDRAGFKSSRTPDWKFIFGIDYEHPLLDRYKATLNSKIAYSDSYTEDTLGFTYDVAWPVHADVNAIIGFGDMTDTWKVSVFARNILGAKQKYYSEFDIIPSTFVEEDMPVSAFLTYGIQFNYNFR